MTLATGARLGPYEVLSPLGAGGMGEVYKARDVRIERTVALKVLPEEFFEDKESIARFEREARLLASLNHPNIAHLYSFEGVPSSTGSPERHLLVMELAEGQTLQERLSSGPLPPEQLLKVSIEIAAALDAAHRAGIVHRDLKPGNVMLTRSGVKLLDFGLAKTAPEPVPPSSSTSLPTAAPRNLTQKGSIFGTVPYMAPETLEGRQADTRSDIFSFGAVLYEMATARKAFEGKSQASLISSIMSSDPPPISSIQPMTPPALDRVVKTCLQKDPDDRWQSARDIGLELGWIAAGAPAASAPGPRASNRLAWGAAGILLLAFLGVLLWPRKDRAGSPGTVRFLVSPPQNAGFIRDVAAHNVAVSPDGRRFAFVASSGGHRALWLHDLESLEARALPGTGGAFSPFWSPDSRFLGFFAEGKLKKLEVSGGPVGTICDTVGGSATWGSDGTIVFAENDGRGGVLRVPSAGGAPSPVTKLDPGRGDKWHFWPSFLPDGRHFLYFIQRRPEGKDSVQVATLSSGESREVLAASSRAMYSAPGRLLFVRDGALLAQPFDARSLSLEGEPAVVSERVPYLSVTGGADFAASGNGVVMYQAGENQSRLAWLDRAGREVGVVAGPRNFETFSLSGDGQRVMAGVMDRRTGSDDLWIFERGREAPSRFTFHEGAEFSPVWSPDGRRVVFTFDPGGGPVTMSQKALDESGNGTSLGLPGDFQIPHSWSSDGRHLLYSTSDPRTQNDLWVLSMSGDRKPVPFLQSAFDEPEGRFSPDGKWIAFVSDESGRLEIYVAAFPPVGEKRMISAAGGSQPRWRRDGKELFYLAPDNRIMAVAVASGGAFQAGTPAPLFRIESASWNRLETSIWDDYEVSADGGRFLVNLGVTRSETLPFTVVLNWPGEVRKLK